MKPFILQRRLLFSMKPICIIAGAGDFYEDAPIAPRAEDFVIAADAGYAALCRRGVRVDEVIGDFDSMGCVPEHPNVYRLPVEKDDTDMLFALRMGLKRGYREFHLYGGVGGRLDHTLANLQCLAWLARQGCRGYLYGDKCVLSAIYNESLRFKPLEDGIFSLFAHGGMARGVSIRGLKYTLDGADVGCDFPIGVSNAFIGQPAEVSVRDGVLIVVFPYGALEIDE